MDELRKRRLAAEDTQENRFFAAIGYFGILFLIPFLKFDSSFARYHGRQGAILFCFGIIYLLLCLITLPSFLGFFVLALGAIVIAILTILGLANALAGQKHPLPVIGKIILKRKK